MGKRTQAASADEPTVEVRLLMKTGLGEANDVVSVPAKIVEQGKAAGEFDDNADAVAYAKTLPQNQVVETEATEA